MLVLTQRKDDCIEIIVPPGEKQRLIKLTVVKVSGGRARLGFEADRDVSIVRSGAARLEGKARDHATA